MGKADHPGKVCRWSMIYIVTHKQFKGIQRDKELYVTLQVGGCKIEDGALSDNTGINIANENSHYSELTGAYWVWKNGLEKGEEIVGIVHYRRYFVSKWNFIKVCMRVGNPVAINNDHISRILMKYDIILPFALKSIHTVGRNYRYHHDAGDLELLENAIKAICPEYLACYYKTMRGHKAYYANMMICNKSLYDKYMEWLFRLLFEVNEHINWDLKKDSYQKRALGFLAERLIMVWVEYNNLSVYEMPVINVDRIN